MLPFFGQRRRSLEIAQERVGQASGQKFLLPESKENRTGAAGLQRCRCKNFWETLDPGVTGDTSVEKRDRSAAEVSVSDAVYKQVLML